MKKYNNAQSQVVVEKPFANATKLSDSLLPIFSDHPKLSPVFQFIEANYHQPISLSDVAIAAGYCGAYLTDLVRRNTGHTVNDWIVERRMAAARALLMETNQCVSEIAQTVGYQHEGYFFRQFRQHHGVPPQAWRKAQRSQSSS